MEETVESYMKKGKDYMEKAINHLKDELGKIRAGKANAAVLNGIMVDYYGTPTPLSQVSNISVPDSKTISIQPWEKTMLAPIEQSIFSANIGLTPMNDGEFIRISIPPMTEERRKDLVKQAKGLGEEAKISLRNARQKLMDFIKKEVKEGYPEDAGKKNEGQVESMIKNYSETINKYIDAKEKDIMTV